MIDATTLTRLVTDKSDIGATRLETIAAPALAQGEASLAIEAFALTANNITYAAFGDAMRYWDFFPTEQTGWGMMPVWGFATVAASTVPELPVGERFYGYFPMAERLIVQPGRFSERGFYDLTPFRQPLPSPYNQYTRCSTDPAYVPELEDLQMLLRPLFFTSYMLADFLSDNGFFGARQVVISSASSKTAYGTAFCLKAMKDAPKLVGLTSKSNRAYVLKLGLYDAVLTYDELSQLAADVPTTYVDFAGTPALRQGLHAHLGKSLVHDCYAGSAANVDYLTDADRYDPVPQPFFAPNQIRKRNKDWGPEVLASRFGETQRSFLTAVSAPENRWMTIVKSTGFASAAEIVRTLRDSGGKADEGYVVRLAPAR
jgi:hypothetical protein